MRYIDVEVEVLENYGLCQFCSKGKQEIPIQDSETQLEVWICEMCDKEMDWESC